MCHFLLHVVPKLPALGIRHCVAPIDLLNILLLALHGIVMQRQPVPRNRRPKGVVVYSVAVFANGQSIVLEVEFVGVRHALEILDADD